MKLLIGLMMLTLSATPAFAFDPGPGPEIALGFTGAIAVGAAYVAARFLRKR